MDRGDETSRGDEAEPTAGGTGGDDAGGDGPSGEGGAAEGAVAVRRLLDEWRWWMVLYDCEAAFLWGVCSYIAVNFVVDAVADNEGFGFWLLMVALVGSAGVMLWRRVEDLVLPWLYGLRRPTAAERRQLEDAWRPVAERFGVTGAPFRLWVQESDQVTASGLAGYTVAVTRWALLMLPREQLEAVLVRELAHRLVRERWLGLAVVWWSLPARGLVWVVRYAPLLLKVPLIGCIVVGFFLLGIFGFVLSLVLFGDVEASAQWALPVSAPFLLALLGRLRALGADWWTADLGYGPALREAFHGWQADRFKRSGVQTRRFGLLDGSPAVVRRIRALDERLEPN